MGQAPKGLGTAGRDMAGVRVCGGTETDGAGRDVQSSWVYGLQWTRWASEGFAKRVGLGWGGVEMEGVWGIGFRRNGITSVREKAEGQETEWGTAEARNGWDGRTRFVVVGLRGGRARRLDLKRWRWVGLGWTAVGHPED